MCIYRGLSAIFSDIRCAWDDGGRLLAVHPRRRPWHHGCGARSRLSRTPAKRRSQRINLGSCGAAETAQIQERRVDPEGPLFPLLPGHFRVTASRWKLTVAHSITRDGARPYPNSEPSLAMVRSPSETGRLLHCQRADGYTFEGSGVALRGVCGHTIDFNGEESGILPFRSPPASHRLQRRHDRRAL